MCRIFEDRATTGTNDQRDAFQEMMALAMSDKPAPFSVLIVHNTNRFARNRFDAVKNKHLLQKQGVRVVSVTQAFLSQGQPEDVIFEGIFEALDEYYSKNLARETLKGMKKHIEKGYWKGGQPPYGYRLQRGIFEGKQRSKLEVYEPEAQWIRKMFLMSCDGVGYKSIANELNAAGFKTRNGGRMPSTQIEKILKNQAYIGNVKYGGEENGVTIENCHPPIVTREVFEATTSGIETRRVKRIYANDYLLSGVIYCQCGSPMSGTSAKSNRYHYYVCLKRIKSNSCDYPRISRDRLESEIIDALKSRILTRSTVRNVVADILRYVREKSKTGKVFVSQTKLDIRGREARLKRLYDQLETLDDADVAEIMPRIRELRKEISGLKEKLSLRIAEESILPDPNRVASDIQKYIETISEFLKSPEFWENKSMVQKVISRISLIGDEIEVEWKYPEIDSKKFSRGVVAPVDNSSKNSVFEHKSSHLCDVGSPITPTLELLHNRIYGFSMRLAG